MVEVTVNDLWLLAFVVFICGGIVTAIVLNTIGLIQNCKHEWEKVIDDSICIGGGSVIGHQVVFFCKKCGKYKSKKVEYRKK